MESIIEEDVFINDEQESHNNSEMARINTQRLQELYEKDIAQAREQKNNQEWSIYASQIESEKSIETQIKQNEIILQLQSTAEQLVQKCENEAHYRVKISIDTDRIKKNMNSVRNYYNIVKQNLDRCVETKNKIEKSYKEIQTYVQIQLKDRDLKLKNCWAKNIKLNRSLKEEHLKCNNLEKKCASIIKNKDEEICNLMENVKIFKKLNEELENKNTNVLQEMNDLIEQKGELLNELTRSKDAYEYNLNTLQKDLDTLKNEISSLEHSRYVDRESIEAFKKEKEDFEKSLNEQNEFLNEIQTKNEVLEASLEKLDQEITVLKQKIIEYETKNEVLKEETEMMKNMFDQLESSYNASKKENEALEQKYEVAKQGINTLTEKLQEKRQIEIEANEKIKEYEEDIKRNQEDFQMNQDIIKEKITSMENLEIEIDSLKKTNQELTNEIIDTKIQMQNDLDTLLIEKEKLVNEIEQLKKEHQERVVKYEEQIQKNTEEVGIKIKGIVEQNDTYKNELEKIRQNEINKHTKEVGQLNDTIRKMGLEISELRVSKTSLEHNLKQKIKETEKLARENQLYQTKPDVKKDLPNLPATQPNLTKIDHFNPITSIAKDENDSNKNTSIIKPLLKRNFANKIREPLHWEDDWSDSNSSTEGEYINRSWKKMDENRHRASKRKMQTQIADDKKENTDEIFDSLQDGFKRPLLKRPRSRKVAQQEENK